ncbi:alpha/beta-hydrolase [Hyaloscypha variabilis F]|uniref:Alpha/beta-hydrolase n=1 Tax=Hyaloscypha variabilis (strain UAMH 11265 / GT02V1 / F) TaxID=1149755 RepID=A0A2J6QYI2_HYAVF|nr:alpha/beta-hydrolase [Hyaloscypha variabilis F]
MRSSGTRFPLVKDVCNILSKRKLQFRTCQTRAPTKSAPARSPRSTAMAQSDSQTLVLPNSRTLGYAEYGNPNGKPLLYFHGFPSSRLEAYALDSIAFRRDIRLLALDRPGFGLSTHDQRRHINDWPTNIQTFASKLGLSRFAVLGVSGGGPYALACARQLPSEMLSAVGVLAGAAVWDRGIWTKGVPWYARLTYLAANYWPSGLRIVSAALVGTLRWIMTMRFVEKKIDALLEAATKAKLAKEKERGELQRREGLMGLFLGGFAQGTSGFVHEARLLTRDWGFRFEDITYDGIQVWHGSRDVNAPVERVRDMVERIPHCTLKEFDENHFGMGKHLEEVLDELIVAANK